jgi:hypothetical protein
MHFLKTIWEFISTQVTPIFDEDWFANSISLAGGILGTIAFFMQLPKKIKPIAINTGNIEFEISEQGTAEQRIVKLESVKLSIVFSNSKKAFGVIEDVFIRIYTSGSFTPESVLYFPTSQITNGKTDAFTPIVLQPNSSASMLLVFGKLEETRSSKFISVDQHYIVDVFYKLRGRSKTMRIPSIYTYNPSEVVNGKIVLKNITQEVSRSSYINKLAPITKSLYKGVLGYVFTMAGHRIKRYIITLPINAILGIFESFTQITIATISNIIAYSIKRPIIIRYLKKIRTIRFKFGNSELKPITISAFDKIIQHIDKATTDINGSIPKTDHLLFKIEPGRGTLERNNKKIIIYMPGDTSIYAHDVASESALSLKFELNKNRWGFNYWTYNNNIITPFNIALMILNYFGFYSIHR